MTFNFKYANINVKLALHLWEVILENKIKENRKRLNITQDELAQAMSVTRQTIISLENGKYTASLLLAHKLSAFFGLTIEELFLFEEE